MKGYWVKTNLFIKKMFSKYVWDIPNTENKIYLSFDDGPTPEITDWVLEQLKQYNAKATFFSIGKNIEANSEIFKKSIDNGHAIGNHTYNHLNGWKTDTREYIANFELCEKSISKYAPEVLNSKIFRPPYGKIKRSQAKILKKRGYKIIMWDVLSADFDQTISKEKCLENVILNIKPGSIIVFHDSIKAFTNLKYVLPKTLEHIKKSQYKYGLINS